MADPQHRLLFVTRSSPFAGSGGSGTYAFDVLCYLRSRGFTIHVVWTEPPDLVPTGGWYDPPPETREIFSLEVIDTIRVGGRFWRPAVVWLPFKARLFGFIKTGLVSVGLWRRKPAASPAGSAATAAVSTPAAARASAAPAWGEACTPQETATVRRAIDRWKPDVVLANYAWMAPTIRATDHTRPPYAVLTLDVRHRQLHLNEGQLREVIGEFTPVEEERQQLQSADAIVAIQEPEAAIFRRMLPGKTVVTAPMAAHPHTLPPVHQPTLLFVGSAHGPNLTGLRWFIAHVWPEIRTQVPSATLLVAGTICSELKETMPGNVRLLGRLPDLATAYAQASVVIAPIFQGSGIKIKLLEAVGYGRACVTTAVGLEGLEALREELYVANTAAEFARVTLELLRDPVAAARRGDALQAKARVFLSPDACYEPIARVLHALAAGQPLPA